MVFSALGDEVVRHDFLLDLYDTPRQRSDLYIRISVSGLGVGIGFQH